MKLDKTYRPLGGALTVNPAAILAAAIGDTLRGFFMAAGAAAALALVGVL